jgi:putative membrane-bound dehydrogenase-like protein
MRLLANRCRHVIAFAALVIAAVLVSPHASERSGAANPAKAAPFKVPPGFVVELVAGPPLIDHPIMAGFDDRGRLYVAESAGQNLKSVDLLKQLPNSIKLLEDTKGSGVFDKATVFADKMTFPMGAMWYNGAVYACSPPSLWKLEDTTGKGVADKRTELVTKFGFIGNAADIHGPWLGPDGRFYWSDGRHGHQIAVAEGKTLKGQAARIFRCRPDGRDIEVVCGGGMDDPVGMAFTSEGEAFAVVDIFISKPGRNDAIMHCIEGGVFPYHEVYKEFKSTGDLLPPVTYLGWVAPSGLKTYRSSVFGSEFRDNLFSTLFNTHKVQRHVLQRDGGTFTSRNEDFLVSTNPDFHPTDVLEDADGSLLVLDTGGWFRIGCPTSQVAKPDIKGGIYRIRREGVERVKDPWGLQLAWDRVAPRELAARLDDSRWAVRDRTVDTLGRAGTDAISVLKGILAGSASVEARRNAVWALTRMESGEARAAVRVALKDKDASVRNAAAHSVALHRDSEAQAVLAEIVVKDPTPAVRREAATALGRIRQAAAVPALLESLRAPMERFLEHSLIYALIEIGDRDATLKGLNDANPQVRRAALIALDQMNGGNLTPDLVTPLLNTPDPALQKTALTVITARPSWAKEIIGLLRDWLTQQEVPADRQETLRGALLAFCKDATIQQLVADTLANGKTAPATRVLVLDTIGEAPLEKLPVAWLAGLGTSLEQADERLARQAVSTVRIRNLKEFDDKLTALASEAKRPAELRVAALGTVAPRLADVPAPLFDFVLTRLEPAREPLERRAAAAVLAQTRLTDAQLARLVKLVAAAGALEMPHLVAPFERSKDTDLGKQLLAALDKAPGLTALSADTLRQTLKGYPEEVRQAAQPLIAKLDVDAGKMKARLDELAPVLSGGDSKRGHTVFFGAKAACSSCHAVKTQGGQIGPDLSTIGAIRTGHDLLESIVFPSASFVRGYEPFVVATKDGKLHNGILKRDTGEAIFLVTAERTEVRIPRSAIESIDPGKVSIMPQGLDMQLTKQEMTDLIAFLLSLK